MSLKVKNCLKQDNIVHLDVSRSEIDDKTLCEIFQKNKKTIASVNLSSCPKITDRALLYLLDLENLSDLNLDDCSRITDTGLKYLTGSKPQSWMEYLFSSKHSPALLRLTNLSLKGCYEISREGLKYLSDLPQLESLDIRHCMHIRSMDISTVLLVSTLNQSTYQQKVFSCLQSSKLLSTYGTLQPNSDQEMLHRIIVQYLPTKTLQIKKSTDELLRSSLYIVREV